MPIKSVLIVDDERLTRISLAAFLQDAGYQIPNSGFRITDHRLLMTDT